MEYGITEKEWGLLGNEQIIEYTLLHPSGMQAGIINYGGAITKLVVPDKEGEMGDVVLGFDSFKGYLQDENPYFNSIIGRYANRIANGKFTLAGKQYTLAQNNMGNSLHGGKRGFDKAVWKGEKKGNQLQLQYRSRDGEEGYPGNVSVTVVYSLTDDNGLQIDYAATTDQPTPINLTNHSYFNLSGGKEATILHHRLLLNADKYIPVNKVLIPTGEIADVKGTPMDFREEKRIGEDIHLVEGGYDHTWVLNKKGNELAKGASLFDTISGRYMEVFTTEPGLQFYSGNFLDGTLSFTKGGHPYIKHGALCLEAQHFPDSPNQPHFPNTILKPGETYRQTTLYKFSVR